MTQRSDHDEGDPGAAIAAGSPEKQPDGGRAAGRLSPLWIIASLVTGFLLPICACGFLLVAGAAGLGSMAPLAGQRTTSSSGSGPAVAIVRVEGTIIGTDDENFISGAGSGTVISELRQAEADPDVKAIVLRVDSPGGTVTGSAQIHDVIRDEIEKPVVVSMFSTAASGGLYISVPADYILARPDTVTGSIGAILTLYNAEELLEEIGVEVTSITTGPNKSIGSPWDTLTPEQVEIFEAFIDESFDDFVAASAAGRGLSEETVRRLADGRIYSGRQALANGLVDALGDLPEAIDKAAELGGITGEPRLIEYNRVPTLSDFLIDFSSRLSRSQAEELINTVYDFTAPQVEYRYIGR